MENYNIIDWINFFENGNHTVNPKVDFLESNSIVLYPGRFYVLEYFAKTKDRYNARPVIISMGISKKNPDSFLCVDLCVMPLQVRKRFIEMYFNIYKREIQDNINKRFLVEDADKQTWMKSFNYENLCKSMTMLPIKNAIKRYKIENTRKIYSLPFAGVYKVIGRYCDEDYYVNGSIRDVQKEFVDKMRK
jgi:hypothetical protein